MAAKAARIGNGGDCHGARQQQALGLLDALLHQIGMGAAPGHAVEMPGEVKRAHMGHARQLVERDGLR